MLAAFAVLAGAAFGPSRAAAQQTVGTVANLQVIGADGSFNVALAGDPDLCTAPSEKDDPDHFHWNRVNGRVSTVTGLSTDGVKALYAALLAAQLTGRSVRLYAKPDPNNASLAPCAVWALDLMN